MGAITLVEIMFDTGTEYFSFDGIGSPSGFYEPYILQINSLQRESPVSGGGYRIGDAQITFINYNQYFTKKKGGSAPGKYFYNRTLQIKHGNIEDGLAAMTTVFTGRIQKWSNNEQGEFVITARDFSYDRFRVHVHATMKALTTDIFPDLEVGVEPRLVPVIYGDCGVDPSVDLSTYDLGGPVPCYLIDTDAGGKWRYVVAQHVCKAVDYVFVYGIRVSAGFAVTTATYGSITMTVIDFDADPRNADRSSELEVTAAVRGITDDGTAGGTLIENPVDALEHFLLNYCETSADEIDSTSFTDTASRIPAYECAFPIVHKDVPRSDVIDKWCASFLGSFYVTRDAKFGVYVKTSATPAAASTIFTADNAIIKDTFHIESNDSVAASLQYSWLHNWPRDFFAKHDEVSIANQDITLNDAILDQVDLWYVRESGTATAVANSYGQLLKEEVEYVSFELTPDLFSEIDLNEFVALTHWQGSGPNGYNRETVRIFGISMSFTAADIRIACKALKLRTPANRMVRPVAHWGQIRPVDSRFQVRPVPFAV